MAMTTTSEASQESYADEVTAFDATLGDGVDEDLRRAGTDPRPSA